MMRLTITWVYLFSLCIFITPEILAQELSDSLKNELKTAQGEKRVNLLNELASLYLQIGKYDESVRYGQEYLKIAKKNKNFQQIISAREILVKAYAETGNYRQALNHQTGLLAAKDSVFNVDRVKLEEEFTAHYEAKLKEQQIETIQKNIVTGNRKEIYASLFLFSILVGSLIVYHKLLKVGENKMLLKKEEERGKFKSTFFANITHEFRTHLSMVFGPLEQLEFEIKDTNQLHLLNYIHTSSNRLLKLINQLLELSKIETGNDSIKVFKQNIIPLINFQASLYESLAEEKQIELKIINHESRVDVFFDNEKIEIIFTNLIYNAFKFNNKHGLVTVETFTQLKDNKEWFSCRISDTGIGIGKEDLPYIFDRFYQSENNFNQNHPGTGIGLSLCKELIALHHGTIEVESVLGKGTSFTFMLLLDNGHFNENDFVSLIQEVNENRAPETLTKNTALITERKLNPDKGKPILLLIEDNSILRNYMVEILHRNYNLMEARDGVDGIFQACQHIPDLIISDVVMPEKDGYEVCRTLKNNELTSHIPIILLTGRSGLNHRLEGLETKADAYLTKPFVQKELLLRINNLIESQEKWRKRYKYNSRLKPEELTLNSIDEQFLKKIMKAVEENISNENFTVLQLGKTVRLSRSQLHRKLKALLDTSPNEFIRSFRLHRAHDLIRQNVATTSEIAYDVGFTSPSYFTKCFRKQFGYPPSVFFQKNHLLNNSAGENTLWRDLFNNE